MRELFILLLFVNPILGQIQLGQDLFGEAEGDFFGQTVSISNDGLRVAIAAPTSDTTDVSNVGRILIYEFQNEEWIQLGDPIYGIAVKDKLGTSMCLSGDGQILAAGAFDDGFGYVSIYEWTNNTDWQQVGTEIFGTADPDNFGFDVSLSETGEYLAVGAPKNAEFGASNGQATCFQRNGASYLPYGQVIQAENVGDQCGYSVSLSADGQRMAVSSRFFDEIWMSTGQVRVFQMNNGIWELVGDPLYGLMPGTRLGHVVSLSADGKRLAVSTSIGLVRIFEEQTEVWIQLGEDIKDDLEESSFGECLDLSGDGNVVTIGAPLHDLNGEKPDAGLVKCYRYSNGEWIDTLEEVEGINPGDQAGFVASSSISFDGSVLAVGSLFNDEIATDAGLTQIFGTHDLTNNEEQELSLEQGFLIYPNPTFGNFKIDLKENFQDQIEVYIKNTSGLKVRTTTINELRNKGITIEESGVYFVYIPHNEQWMVKRLVVLTH